jgi:hypothetical protein
LIEAGTAAVNAKKGRQGTHRKSCRPQTWKGNRYVMEFDGTVKAASGSNRACRVMKAAGQRGRELKHKLTNITNNS